MAETTEGSNAAAGEPWSSLIKHAPLGILTDLDGTILPFAHRPEEARPTSEIVRLVRDLAELPGVTLAVVSGRPRSSLEEFFPAPRAELLVAEHGAWRSFASPWELMLQAPAWHAEPLAATLEQLVARYPNALIERKTYSIAFHYREVSRLRKPEMLVQLAAVVDPWIHAHPTFEKLWGAEVLEIRPRAARKDGAVRWIRERLGPDARLLIVGDDITDEDMFTAAGEDDVSVLVHPGQGRTTRARFCLSSVSSVHVFYRALARARREAAELPAAVVPERIAPRFDANAGAPYHLLVISNRLPELRSADVDPVSRKRNVGGLVSALSPVLSSRKGVWLGWSGRTRPDANGSEVEVDGAQGFALAWVDFPEEWHRHYYNGFSNSALWPLMHSFPGRLRVSHRDWESYVRVNQAFAEVAVKLVGPSETVWVHDYHLLLVGKYLRAAGHRGPIGLFQHIPFPGPDIFSLLPWSAEILEGMLDFDLVGFHTRGYVENFLRCMSGIPGVRMEGDRAVREGRSVRSAAFPLGIIPEDFQESGDDAAKDEIAGLVRAIGESRLVLGVDRLDYTKGIPERIEAFGRLLELFPEWRRKVSLVQVSVPSRADVPEYVEQRARVENIVGRINGEFGEVDWVPIRYLYRSYGRAHLSELYRLADVGYVTPLRDGMNLVAKEYVAAQDAEDPGVLLLSRFAGAAEELSDALLTNPWDAEGTARDLDRALHMPLDERQRRHEALFRVVSKTTALTWAEDFLGALGPKPH
jgi:alpha,alpha-trehalose-phosphate synthase [UDP-forming]/trehalose-phosphatase